MPLLGLLRLIVRLFAALLAPPRCAGCDQRLRRNAVFCSACSAEVELTHWTGEATDPLVASTYEGPVREAIRRFKFLGRHDLAEPLAHLWLGLHASDVGTLDAIVPMPLHPLRLRDRGYNQSWLLARHLSRALRVPLWVCLERTRMTASQALLDADARRSNVANAFKSGSLGGERILLLDDVITTGATMEAAKTALMDAGAREVVCAAIARREWT